MRKVSNWGNYPKIDAQLFQFDDTEKLRKLLSELESTIPRGKGRCYGDSALSSNIISTLYYDKILSFDEEKGTICCQSGVTLENLLEIIVPRGWFLPVVPGTKFITIGGAVASDIHGKNHHKEGSFSNHLIDIGLMLEDGTIVNCSKDNNSSIFWTTCGGMGLTGVILYATIRLKSIETAYIRQQTMKANNLDEIMNMFEQSENWVYSVAWIDCLAKGNKLGRSILMKGEHAAFGYLKENRHKRAPLKLKPKKKLKVPFNFPGFALNYITIKAFNFLYYNKYPDKLTESIIDYNTFFFPLDSIHNWNKIYGKEGFAQYQLVLPKDKSREGLIKILGKISESGMDSFLAVLKLFGRQDGFISFPMEGYTLSLDFPIRGRLFEFLDELDKIVLDYGGRLYLTKDVRMKKEMFMRSYTNANNFIIKVKEINQDLKFRSLQSERIGITQ